MVANMQLLDALKQIGLNLYERKLWVALLSRGNATAGELSSLAKVPHSRTYDVLESLAEKGFVMIQASKPLKYVAVAPKEALERAKNKLKKDLDVSINRITNLQGSSHMKELNKIHKKGVDLVEPGEMTGSLKGSHTIHQQLETLFRGARNSISILTTNEGLNEINSKYSDMLKRSSNKGVKIRIAATVGKENATAVKTMKRFADVRKLNKSNVQGRICVVDGNHVVMALTDEKVVHPTQDFAFWTKSEHIAGSVLGPMFNVMWQKLPSA
jgi:sugar-specific transcriptional regulator TrmB